jgi:hypothetical protein
MVLYPRLVLPRPKFRWSCDSDAFYMIRILLVNNVDVSSILDFFGIIGVQKHMMVADAYNFKELKQKCILLLSLKRRRIHCMVHLDRFLVRELFLMIWASRY